MKNKIIIILQVLISVMFFRCASINKFVSEVTKYNDKDLHAQGISSQGRIYLGAKEKMERKGQVNLACTVDIIDPNGNKILEPGETITFVATIRNFSLDYLNHLFKEKDPLGPRLATIHNLFFTNKVVEEAREKIKQEKL